MSQLSSLCSRFIPVSVRAALRNALRAGSPSSTVAESTASPRFPRTHGRPRARLGKQLARVLQRDLRRLAGEKARKLLHPRLAIDRSDAAVRPSAQHLLLGDLVALGEDRDLWQMRDADHLPFARDRG